MKKFMKVCAVLALIMIVLGAVLGAAGSTAAGRTTISQVVDTVTGGRVQVRFLGWGLPSVEVGDMKVDVGDITTGFGVNYNIGDASMFSKDHDILSGDVEKYCPGSGIRNLEVTVGGCHFETKTSEDGSVYLEVDNARKFQGYVEGDTLYVRATMRNGVALFEEKSQVILYLPENYSFDEVEIDMGAGEMEFDRLKAEEALLEVGAGRIVLKEAQAGKLTVEVGAGQIELKDMTVETLEAEIGMGEFLAGGVINGDASVECSMGNVEMRIEGREEDFNYRLEGAMGNIDLGRQSYGGFAEERDIDNHADKTMEVECSMGNISIKFK